MAVGRISYGLYLWHAPFAFTIWPLLSDGQDRLGDLVWTLAVIGASFACAIMSWFFVERPFMATRSSQREQLRPSTAAADTRNDVLLVLAP
jgi:peptidoglycan/LPS O-acetylase OafA/YrhL